MELQEIKDYLRVEDEDDTLLALQRAAEEYLENAGVLVGYEKELYKIAIKLLISHWYENRMIYNEKSVHLLPFSLNAIIMQLKYEEVAL